MKSVESVIHTELIAYTMFAFAKFLPLYLNPVSQYKHMLQHYACNELYWDLIS